MFRVCGCECSCVCVHLGQSSQYFQCRQTNCWVIPPLSCQTLSQQTCKLNPQDPRCIWLDGWLQWQHKRNTHTHTHTHTHTQLVLEYDGSMYKNVKSVKQLIKIQSSSINYRFLWSIYLHWLHWFHCVPQSVWVFWLHHAGTQFPWNKSIWSVLVYPDNKRKPRVAVLLAPLQAEFFCI